MTCIYLTLSIRLRHNDDSSFGSEMPLRSRVFTERQSDGDASDMLQRLLLYVSRVAGHGDTFAQLRWELVRAMHIGEQCDDGGDAALLAFALQQLPMFVHTLVVTPLGGGGQRPPLLFEFADALMWRCVRVGRRPSLYGLDTAGKRLATLLYTLRVCTSLAAASVVEPTPMPTLPLPQLSPRRARDSLANAAARSSIFAELSMRIASARSGAAAHRRPAAVHVDVRTLDVDVNDTHVEGAALRSTATRAWRQYELLLLRVLQPLCVDAASRARCQAVLRYVQLFDSARFIGAGNGGDAHSFRTAAFDSEQLAASLCSALHTMTDTDRVQWCAAQRELSDHTMLLLLVLGGGPPRLAELKRMQRTENAPDGIRFVHCDDDVSRNDGSGGVRLVYDARPARKATSSYLRRARAHTPQQIPRQIAESGRPRRFARSAEQQWQGRRARFAAHCRRSHEPMRSRAQCDRVPRCAACK